MLQSAPKIFFIERQVIIPQTKSFQTTLRLLAILRIKKPFFSKKCIFWPENDVFSKKLFYSKLIRDQNYIMCTYQKIHFQNKILTLQFSPDSTQSLLCLLRCCLLVKARPPLQGSDHGRPRPAGHRSRPRAARDARRGQRGPLRHHQARRRGARQGALRLRRCPRLQVSPGG